ncbi:MAG: sulfotransferase domain-containing protein [Pseudomonadota bacterium]|jgi:hypothetical protein|nr:sulfotransferase domain-containing protein [Alphaproteobacteria bacterium]MEC7701212.1 sulfotransferase domain-containing protein [Pseudomonadota bacterium]MEC9235329.1 sulfotransferase domain-containing protein [Pseudomonadota bacterium]MED5424120.1 sulfotransferase domain-containing protein [Pseudomonadota bacterium]
MKWKLAVLLISILALIAINMNIEHFDPTPKKHILIIGTAKSGTTAVYKSVKDAMGEKLTSYFEPSESNFKAALRSRAKQILVKITLIDRSQYKNLYEDIHQFDKKIMVIRDPRDILISNLLYTVRWMRFSKDPVRLQTFITALKEKETNPRSHSLLALYQLRDRLESEVMQSWESPRSWHDEYNDYAIAVRMIQKTPELYILRYEDYVDGELDALSDYLGLSITGDADVSTLKEQHSIKKSVRNIARSKTYGNWKNWFTAEDVDAFRPLFQPLMDQAGYSDDWALSPNPTIDAEKSSAYVTRIVSETAITW